MNSSKIYKQMMNSPVTVNAILRGQGQNTVSSAMEEHERQMNYLVENLIQSGFRFEPCNSCQPAKMGRPGTKCSTCRGYFA